MQVKIFMDNRPEMVEAAVNQWLEQDGRNYRIVKTDTAVAGVAERPDDGSYPCIVVSIWYDPN
jgi:hypothetical protein